MPRNLIPAGLRFRALLLAVLLCVSQGLGRSVPTPASASDSGAALDFDLAAVRGVRFSLSVNSGLPHSPGLAPSPGDRGEGEAGSESSVPEGTRMKKKWGRAYIEFGALFSYAAINYWRKYAMFIEDWQYELTCADQYKRFFTTEALKFDSNSFYLNWSHGLAGGVYYQFARTNDLSWLESWIFSLAGSMLWEYGVEWREVVSINDLTFTGLGSYPIGEAWFQTARYLAARPELPLRILSFINPFLKINRWLDRKKPASRAYDVPGWHDFELSVGARRLSSSGRDAQDSLFLGFRAEIVGPPGFGKAATFRKSIQGLYLSELSLDLAVGGDRAVDEALALGWTETDLASGGFADEINFSARTVNWAWYRQDIDDLSRGSSFSLGLGSAFTYFRKTPALRIDTGELRVRTGEDLQLDKPRFFRDKISVVHLAGPVLDWWRYGREARLRVTAEAYIDFALVNSFALNTHSADHDISGMKTTLLHYGYYYAWGGTLRGRGDLEWKSFRFRALAAFQLWDSIEGLDRFQDDLTEDGDADDSRIRFLAGIDWAVPRMPLRVFVTYETLRRRGRIGETEVRGLETRGYAGLRFFF